MARVLPQHRVAEADMNYLLYPLLIAIALGVALVSAASYTL